MKKISWKQILLVASIILALFMVFGSDETRLKALVFYGIIVGPILYFIPSLVAGGGHRNFMAISMLNLLLGWTLLGWVGALVWALYREKGQID